MIFPCWSVFSVVDVSLSLGALSYHRPLARAHQWLSSGDPESKRAAVELLKELYQRYDHAVAVGQELVLALMEGGPESRAEAEVALRTIDARFAKLDEESSADGAGSTRTMATAISGSPRRLPRSLPSPRKRGRITSSRLRNTMKRIEFVRGTTRGSIRRHSSSCWARWSDRRGRRRGLQATSLPTGRNSRDC